LLSFEWISDTTSRISLIYRDALETNLAVRLAPDFNKPVHPDLKAEANQSLSAMKAATNEVRESKRSSRMPLGSGNARRFNNFHRFYTVEERPKSGPQLNKMAIGNVQDFIEHFDSYLMAGETVSSYTLTAETGLTVLSDSLASPDVNYRVRADAMGTDGEYQKIVIVATTSLGRIETRVINFQLIEVS